MPHGRAISRTLVARSIYKIEAPTERSDALRVLSPRRTDRAEATSTCRSIGLCSWLQCAVGQHSRDPDRLIHWPRDSRRLEAEGGCLTPYQPDSWCCGAGGV